MYNKWKGYDSMALVIAYMAAIIALCASLGIIYTDIKHRSSNDD